MSGKSIVSHMCAGGKMVSLKSFFQKYLFAITVFIGWIITVYSLYFIKYKMFGGAIEVLLLYVIIFPPIIAITDFLAKPKENENKTKKKMGLVLDVIAACILTWAFFISPYAVGLYAILTIALILILLSRFPRLQAKLKNKANQKERSVFVLSIFAILIIVPLVFTSAAGIKTIRNTQILLENTHYTDTAYVDIINNKAALAIVFEGKTTVTDGTQDDLGFYLFKASKDNKEYAIAVNILRGDIVGEVLLEGNPYIHYYLR
ncbi:hypothetical protein [Desulfitobacterium hafniense]|uniref:Uncharacterized protein n=4 Tax=root TaxID=1 RepID=Q24YU4_DESHY|nr:hypothetical protein [Desulfitobacterium hafniense]MEA5021527.1 hypothetical protein [Desulfitobacterium hafniense]BAE82798.1 hypothetical protein DSY1009 [Desulfitobacterium hafniense Y51]